MAMAANKIRIGAMVSGRCGSLGAFAGEVVAATSTLITVRAADGTERDVAPAWAEPLVVDGLATPPAGPMPTLRQACPEAKANLQKRLAWRERKAAYRERKSLGAPSAGSALDLARIVAEEEARKLRNSQAAKDWIRKNAKCKTQNVKRQMLNVKVKTRRARQ